LRVNFASVRLTLLHPALELGDFEGGIDFVDGLDGDEGREAVDFKASVEQ